MKKKSYFSDNSILNPCKNLFIELIFMKFESWIGIYVVNIIIKEMFI